MDEIELPSEEKSHMWKKAVIFYSVATPLILSSAVMLLIFKDSMLTGQVCKFYELAGNSQAECLANYANDPEKYNLAAGFRYEAFIGGVMVPIVFFLFEFF